MALNKKEQRNIALAARRALSEEERASASSSICRRLADLPIYKEAKTIFAYAATWDEVDLSDICALAREQGKTVAYPISYKGGIMEAYAPEGPEDWKDGILGIRVPDKTKARLVAPEEFDLVLVPCVAFDEERRRLGHGGGYYDRYLPKCTGSKFVLVAFEAQKLPQISVEGHDILMDALVTEAKVY